MILTAIIIALFAVYALLINYYQQSWNSIPYYNPPEFPASVKFSIIIPARNEEANIPRLLNSLKQQSYPSHLFEIIVIDDHSTDNTAAVVRSFPGVKLLQLQEDNINSYKKKAIETSIAAASGEWIATTDADCQPVGDWLKTLASFITENKSVFVAAPVVIDCSSSLVQMFQAIDFMVLQGITGASVYKNIHSMCNGANLAYRKDVFYEVNGFAGIDSIASGDDMLLMHKIWKKYPSQVHYLKSQEAMVHTEPMSTWKQFFNQRIRWASKAVNYDDKRIIAVLVLVYLVNLSFLVLVIAGFWHFYYWIWLAAAWVIKTLVELPFFTSQARFFNKQWAIKFFFLFQPLHIAYTIISGFFGQLGKYEWKGRKVR